MKTSNLTSRISKKQTIESDNIIVKDQGITRRLLEKYKPKHVSNIEEITNWKDTNMVA